MENIKAISEEKKVVNIDTLIELMNDSKKHMTMGEIIGILEMCEVLMSPVVRKLGVCIGILYK